MRAPTSTSESWESGRNASAMYRVDILAVAEDDIVERIDFVRHRWDGDTADRAYTDLMDKLALLATQPHPGKVPVELSALGILNYRVLVHEFHTNVLYEVDAEAAAIVIHMVFGSTQDFQSLLYKRIMRS